MAKKKNDHPDQIDLTPWAWISVGPIDPQNITQPSCGSCHPGGGGLEYDRDGQRYSARLQANPGLAQSLDGDYFQSRWDKTGVVEADCFICHLPGYDFKERTRQLKMLNYKWAGTAASGIGQVTGFVREDQQPVVSYNTRLFNNDGRIVLDLAYPPPAENCVFCHGLSDVKKRGFSWDDRVNHDVHNLQGMNCAHCHPAIDDMHNFAKGDENVSTVRDDLDNTIKTCGQCHEQGYMGAPRPAHMKIRPNHLDKLACEVCHIPALHRAAGEGFDVTTGGMVNYAKMMPPPGAKKIGQEFTWHPQYQRDEHGKLWPVNVLKAVFFTNQDKDGIHYPLFARELKKGYEKAKAQLQPKNPQRPELHTPEQIKTALAALTETLQGNKRFQQVKPFFHKGGRLYFLDDKGEVASRQDDTWAGHLEGFNINHNVAPASLALGANGCGDCHSAEAHMFKGQIVTDMFGPGGKPVTQSSGRFFGCQPWAFYVNQFHQMYLTPYVSIFLLLLVFAITLHYTGMGPKGADFYAEPAVIQRFSLAERWTHLVRMIAFLLLTFTGYIFFYNNVSMLRMFFDSPAGAVIFHWVTGLIFLAASAVSVILWARDARFAPYDREWLKKHGGYFSGTEVEVPAGRLNAGQKIFVWLTAALSLFMGATGVLLIFKNSLPLTFNCLMSTMHGLVAVIFVAAVIAHAYLGTIANPGTWRALVDGKVGRKWAKKHHSEWYKEVAAQEQPAEKQEEGGE
ncbi:MAG: formate dehydrogenase subunit gamma [Deltaproteobacteria bacterium]|nr:formate dehydrogenase subunit gamma [Deltaproteobacteria bacterium]